MARKAPPPIHGIEVDTVETLHLVQLALHKGRVSGDASLLDAAESVLSAIIVVLRTRRAVIPDAVQPMLERLYE